MPRLLVVSPYFPPKRGGVENYASAVSRGLAERGWEVAVATSGDDGGPGQVEVNGRITIHRLKRLARVSNTPIHPAWPLRMAGIVRSFQPAIINAHMPVPGLPDLGIWLAGGVPTVVTYHNDVVKAGLPKRFAWWLFSKMVSEGTLRRATRIIATSESYAARSPLLSPHLGKVRVIPPGVDLRRFHLDVPVQNLRRRYPGREIVLFVGQMDRTHGHKGVPQLLKALALARPARPAILGLFAGPGDGVEELRLEAHGLGLAGCVEFLGPVTDDVLPAYFSLAQVLVLPSLNDSEGFGMVLLEAAAAGTPAIATRVGGIPAAIEDGQTGLLVPPDDPGALADAIGRLLRDQDLRLALGANARRRVVEQFSWEHQIDKHHRLFLELLAR